MHAYRRISKLPISQAKRAFTTAPARKMAFLQRSFANEQPSSFTSLFRLLDDYDSYNNNSSVSSAHGDNRSHNHHRASIMKTFNPKFDVRELEDAYELHGELPGIEQKDVEIEFVDAQTLSIKGRIERSHQSGNSPSSAAAAIEDAAPKTADNNSSHKATVEDEDAAENAASVTSTTAATAEATASSSSTEVTKADEKPVTAKSKVPEAKYWLSERSIGEFSRHFTFPVRINQDGVTASMKNGILTITVPKIKKHESRKITIS